ncbi:MAG TPA: hypothetical protein VM715_01140 [Candidatus Acidoferrum sp.]|jgi:photosystem II stability/assembly factor-like uncharacterized protein|nr:hypothetical protein [Candidatus Acidoferrum sp.]
MFQRSLVTFLFVSAVALCNAQNSATVHQPKLTPEISGTTQLLISVSPVNSQIVWAAGTGGTYVVTTDGGNTWKSGVVPGAENLQFRDVQGVSDKVAYLMSIGDNTTDFRIYKTYNGGATWHLQFVNHTASAFYDCFAFWEPNRGVAHSDAVNGVFPDIRTFSGQHWQSISGSMPPALPGEASFSSSGTCITTQGESNAWITTGGATVSRILATTDAGNTWNSYDTPLFSSPSAGGLSVAFRDAMHGMVGGGDLAVNYRIQAATSDDGGHTWTFTKKPPLGGTIFCLAYAKGMTLDAGASSDAAFERTVVITSEDAPNFDRGAAAWTPDEGQTWYRLPNASGYWAVAFANPQAGWFVGNNGQILKISF